MQPTHGETLGLKTIRTEIDIRGVPSDEIQKLIQGVLSVHAGQIVTLKHGATPLATLSVGELTSSRDLGLVYHVSVHTDDKERPAVTFFDPRTELKFKQSSLYLPSRSRCVVAKDIGEGSFRLPHLADIERGSHLIWQSQPPYQMLSDTERLTYSADSSSNGRHYANLSIGRGKRTNEDAIILKQLSDNSKLIGVVDGIGGRGGGLLASRAVISALSHHVTSTHSFREIASHLPHELQSVFTDINERYPLLTSSRMGVALAVVKVGRSFLECARAGDCRIVHFRASRKRPRCTWATEDQVTPSRKPTNVLCLEKGLAQPIKLSIIRRQIERGDTIIIGSDGFWQTVTTKEVEHCLHRHKLPTVAGEELEKIINERMRNQKRLRDNFSFVIYQH